MSIQALLVERGIKNEGEILVGWKFFHGEGEHTRFSAYFVNAADHEGAKAYLEATAYPTVRRADVANLSVQEFFGLFKRFYVAVARQGFNLIDRDFEFTD